MEHLSITRILNWDKNLFTLTPVIFWQQYAKHVSPDSSYCLVEKSKCKNAAPVVKNLETALACLIQGGMFLLIRICW